MGIVEIDVCIVRSKRRTVTGCPFGASTKGPTSRKGAVGPGTFANVIPIAGHLREGKLDRLPAGLTRLRRMRSMLGISLEIKIDEREVLRTLGGVTELTVFP